MIIAIFIRNTKIIEMHDQIYNKQEGTTKNHGYTSASPERSMIWAVFRRTFRIRNSYNPSNNINYGNISKNFKNIWLPSYRFIFNELGFRTFICPNNSFSS